MQNVGLLQLKILPQINIFLDNFESALKRTLLNQCGEVDLVSRASLIIIDVLFEDGLRKILNLIVLQIC